MTRPFRFRWVNRPRRAIGTGVPRSAGLLFHGYPSAIHQLVYKRANPQRFHVRGYVEEGTTTTPFDMLVRNQTSRYHLVIEALRRVSGFSSRAAPIIERYERKLRDHRRYIEAEGADPPEIRDWVW